MSALDDTTRLRHMLDAALKIDRFIQGETRQTLEHDEKLQLALVRLIEIVGEAASRLSTPFQAAHPETPWAAIIGMRNRLIHAYFAVDLDRVWETVIIAIPPLIAQLQAILPPDKGPSGH